MKNKIASKLAKCERHWVIEAAAEACEVAYRRGFQQGARLGQIPGAVRVDLHEWRFSAPPTKAPNPDGVDMKREALEIFAIEPRQYDPFINLGFERPAWRRDL
jgi:hypothetical protein